MPHHSVRLLAEAKPLTARPAFIPQSRPRGRKALGTRYERALAAQLGFAKHGQWWQFEDASGIGYCQTDLIIDHAHMSLAIVIEVKHTWTAQGHAQLDELYLPVVSRALRKPVLGIQCCKHLTSQTGRHVYATLPDAIEAAARGLRPVLHWPGKAALWPRGLPALAAHIATIPARA